MDSGPAVRGNADEDFGPDKRVMCQVPSDDKFFSYVDPNVFLATFHGLNRRNMI